MGSQSVAEYEGAPIPRVSAIEIPRVSVTPEVSSSPARKVIKDTNAASSTIIGFRYTIEPGTDALASQYLAEQLGDTYMVSADSSVLHTVDAGGAAFDVYVACVANVAANDADGTILSTGTTAADTLTAMTKLSFEAGTKLIELTCHPTYEISSVTYSQLSVGGSKDA